MRNAGLQITVERSALYAFGVLTLVVMAVVGAVAWANGELGEELLGSLGKVVAVAVATAGFYFAAEFVHLMGHALAARATGHPMSQMLFSYILGMSLYPPDEPPLPDRVHMQRALGGVVAYGLLLAAVIVFWLSTRDAPGWPLRYLATAMLTVVGLLFAVSALLTDGLLFIARKEWRADSSATATRI